MGPINIYALVAPAVFLLIAFEVIYCLVKKNGYYSFQDSIMGLGTMIIAQCVNVAVSVAVVLVYGWIYENYAVTQLESTFLNYAICYVLVDFLFYWFHRAGHRINFLWAAHVPHHSAEELNYAVALRASFTQRAASFLFYWPLAVIGFSPEIILPVVAANLVYQLIPHTRVIGKLPTLIDSWLNTPYHHQVHHGANKIYWDKNYGGTFIIWDKLFGTYQDQVEEVFYGVTIHPKSWDPTFLNFHWFIVLWKDACAADHWIDKIKIWFMPPGWRPRNLPAYEKLPATSAKDQVKFQTQALQGSTVYLVVQLIVNMGILQLVIRNDSPLSNTETVAMSLLLWFTVTSWGAILSSKKWAKSFESIRLMVSGFALLYVQQKYFHHLNALAAMIVLSTIAFLIWTSRLRFRIEEITRWSSNETRIKE